MKKNIISFLLFFLVLGFVIFSNTKLVKFCDKTLEISNAIEELMDNENWEESYLKTLELKSVMSESFPSISVYINHTDMDNLNIEILKLTQYVKEEDSAEGLATLHVIKCYAEYMKELQEINIVNIL